MAYPTDLLGLSGLWFQWLLMLMVYSYVLYKETPAYRFAEHLYIGMTMAISLIVAIGNIARIAIRPLMAGEVIYIIPLILGFAMYALLVSDYRWVSRYPVAILVGAGFGLGMRGVLIPNLLSQVSDTITPPVSNVPIDWLTFAYIAIGTVCAITYFLLTYEHTGALNYPTRVGRWMIMIGLGAYFGNTVLFRMTMLSGRAQFFLQVLKIIPM
jgi:hypothetical protein